MWRYLVAKFLTNASGVTWWTNFLLTQVAPPGGQILYLCKWRHLVAKFCTNAIISNKFMWRHLLTKFASYRVLPAMVSTHGSVVPLAMFNPVRMEAECKVCKQRRESVNTQIAQSFRPFHFNCTFNGTRAVLI